MRSVLPETVQSHEMELRPCTPHLSSELCMIISDDLKEDHFSAGCNEFDIYYM